MAVGVNGRDKTRANQLAHHLASLGVGPEVCVGLYMRRLADVLVAILGVLKAGGAYVPLDPAYPPERIAFMLKDSYASILITHQSIYDLRFTIYDLEESDTAIVNLDTDWGAIDRQPAGSARATHPSAKPTHSIALPGTFVVLGRDFLLSEEVVVQHDLRYRVCWHRSRRRRRLRSR